MARVVRLAIDAAKLTEYLLNPDHPEGGSKARFLIARGFRCDDPFVLSGALVLHAQRGWPGDTVPAVGAVKHRIVGPLTCPDGSLPEVLSVWQVADSSDTALLVTARPHRRKGG